MLVAVHALYIVKEQIGEWEYLYKVLKRNISRRIYGSMYPLSFAGFKHMLQKVYLQHTFSARKGNSAI